MEGEEVGVEVEAGSPPATDPNGQPTAQAPVQPAQETPLQRPFHLDPRFQQLVREGQMSKQTIANLQQQYEQSQAKLAELERKQNQGRTSPEEDEQLRQAGTALERIMMSNPEMLDRLLSQNSKFKAWADNADKFQAMIGLPQQMQQREQQAASRQVMSQVTDLASKAGYPQDPAYLQRLYRLVIAEAQTIPGGPERFSSGDYGVIDEAFKSLEKDFFGQTQRAGTAALINTKNATRSLPPAPRGGAAGPPGLPKFDPKTQTPQDRMNQLSQRARTMLDEGSKE